MITKVPYGAHPSPELRQLFAAARIPYQGQEPTQADVLFVGLDANYAPEISEDVAFFGKIIEYHTDGVSFWGRYGVHHPFLLPDYPLRRNSGGVPYHRKFAAMGLLPEHGRHISFIELLDVPTIGSTDESTFWRLFNPEHVRRLDQLFQSGRPRLILLPDKVIRLMHATRRRVEVFRWLPRAPEFGIVCRLGDTAVHKVRHFSSAVSTDYLRALGDVVRSACGGAPPAALAPSSVESPQMDAQHASADIVPE